MRRNQLSLSGLATKNFKNSYGGSLQTTRAGRQGARPLATRTSMHLVMRSTKAKGAWSFLKPRNQRIVTGLVQKFARKYGVRVNDLSNVGNHLHLDIQLTNRHTYAQFIRALTGAIALKISGRTRWSAPDCGGHKAQSESAAVQSKALRPKLKFWDYRPFTRIVTGFKAKISLRDYLQINKFEGFGYSKNQARFLWEWDRGRNTC